MIYQQCMNNRRTDQLHPECCIALGRSYLFKLKKDSTEIIPCYPLRLPDLDSNQDKQSQSLSYYRYTIRQFSES